MATGNTFPMPIGQSVSFSGLQAGATSPNFTWGEPGFYMISLEMADLNAFGDQVQLQSVSGSTNTAVLTMQTPGYYKFAVPPGGGTYNFTTVNPIKRVGMTKMFP